ncbi:MAG: hypothetical protein LBW77_04450 [Verrucomicrobiota bacterium]|nr:hypothetical protein [Verrucomicrobiota bacterium]
MNEKPVFENLGVSKGFRPSNRDKTRILSFLGMRCGFGGLSVRKPQPKRPDFPTEAVGW